MTCGPSGGSPFHCLFTSHSMTDYCRPKPRKPRILASLLCNLGRQQHNGRRTFQEERWANFGLRWHAVLHAYSTGMGELDGLPTREWFAGYYDIYTRARIIGERTDVREKAGMFGTGQIAVCRCSCSWLFSLPVTKSSARAADERGKKNSSPDASVTRFPPKPFFPSHPSWLKYYVQ
jgi:hypothetical protein